MADCEKVVLISKINLELNYKSYIKENLNLISIFINIFYKNSYIKKEFRKISRMFIEEVC